MKNGMRGFPALLGILLGQFLLMQSAAAITGPHDMSGAAPGGQSCVACHTPHHAASTKLLWNHVMSASNYAWSDTTATTGGTPLPTNLRTSSGSSKLCLSCHDGTVAIGAIENPSMVFDSDTMEADHQVGPDMQGNHPVGVPYPYGGVVNTYNGITSGSNVVASGYNPTPSHVVIYMDPASAGPSNRGIECSSCHDPHGTAYDDYLRDATTNSAICLNCHTK